ncbi:MAG: polyamine aminopropyltransferase, partial [Thermoleophilaceae bacterium]|nr:polyamine aminopropyltransferase [Thermoleophilaceae bacterium]
MTLQAELPSPVPHLPVPVRRARALILFAVLTVAVCGFAYELVIIALGTYLFGNSVLQVSVVLASFVSAMGVGSLLAKPLQRRAVEAFVVVEVVVALLGGSSALLLYASFAWLDLYEPTVVVVAAAIGVLVGCEIPLLMSLLQRVQRQEAGSSVADLLAADYLGAVVAGVGFPLVLLPSLGQIQGALAVGALNALAGLLVLWLLSGLVPRRRRRRLLGSLLAALAALGVLAAVAPAFELSARQQLYEDPVVHSERSQYQDIVLTSAARSDDLRLFLNGDLQFSSRDEYRYHEALVHPVMAGRHERVLVLGGGDGLALREVLRYRDVERAVLVELDPRMIELASADARLRELNRGSFADPRVEVVEDDAFNWLRRTRERFDAVIVDFPDPDDAGTAKLYSVELYALLQARALAPGGRVAVQGGSPYFAPDAFWSVNRSM